MKRQRKQPDRKPEPRRRIMDRYAGDPRLANNKLAQQIFSLLDERAELLRVDADLVRRARREGVSAQRFYAMLMATDERSDDPEIEAFMERRAVRLAGLLAEPQMN